MHRTLLSQRECGMLRGKPAVRFCGGVNWDVHEVLHRLLSQPGQVRVQILPLILILTLIHIRTCSNSY